MIHPSLAGVEEWNLLRSPHEAGTVRVVTIKHPPVAVEGITTDKSMVGQIYELAPQTAIWMIAAGWARSETRAHERRERDLRPSFDRRRDGDRRSV
jgi:hypothetical protein